MRQIILKINLGEWHLIPRVFKPFTTDKSLVWLCFRIDIHYNKQ